GDLVAVELAVERSMSQVAEDRPARRQPARILEVGHARQHAAEAAGVDQEATLDREFARLVLAGKHHPLGVPVPAGDAGAEWAARAAGRGLACQELVELSALDVPGVAGSAGGLVVEHAALPALAAGERGAILVLEARRLDRAEHVRLLEAGGD